MENAISISGISKVYDIYDSPKDRLKELLSPTKKKYCRKFSALDGVTFDVARGETLGIIGRNGSGKSTLLQIICGVLKPTTGTVETHGRISALLELGTGFNPEFTGRENVYLNGALMGLTKEEINARYQAIVDFADIGDFINQPVKKYSSGMYVRLAFACAVNVDPEILVIDEALSVGDVFFQQKCFRKMAEFKEQGKTMLLVSHGMDAILRNCSRAVHLKQGKVLAIGDAKDVMNHYLRAYEGGGNAEPIEPASQEKKIEKTDTRTYGVGAGGVREDKCKTYFNYNKNEYRYGNGKASIVDYQVLGKDASAVRSGDTFIFRYVVEYDFLVEFPIYGFSVKTKEGVTVYSTNTFRRGIKVGPMDRGDTVTVEFSQRANLIAGDYFITIGVAEVVESGLEAVDRRYDLAHLAVLPVDESRGFANLFSEIKVKEAGSEEG